MPIDKPEANAAPTTRRTFLARAAVSSALVGVGAAAPLGLLSSSAGASPTQAGPVEQAPPIDNPAFAALAVPLEMAAVLAYQAALGGQRLDSGWQDLALRFQGHHQSVVDALTDQLAADAAPPTANAVVLSDAQTAISTAADQDGVLVALSDLESTLAATHLYALGGIADTSLAKIVGQVLAVESQQSASLRLGLTAPPPLAELAPATVTTADARTELFEAGN